MAHAFYSMEMPNALLVRQGLENLSIKIPEIGRQGMFKFARRVYNFYAYTKTNPPKHGKYVRTFAMKQSRKILKEKFGYVFVMDPLGPKGQKYASFVVGTMKANSQVRWHKETWVPLRQVVITEAAKLPVEIRKELGELVARETRKANRP